MAQNTNTIQTEPTDDEIDAAILAALADTGEELVRWTHVRRRVPGTFWRQSGGLWRLWHRGKVYIIKIKGSPYVSLDDAPETTASGRPREVRIL